MDGCRGPGGLGALAPSGIELCEEPVRGVHDLTKLARPTDVALALEETAAEPGALDRRLCTAACLKIARWRDLWDARRLPPRAPGWL